MYICNDTVCDPCCDFCWYCTHSEMGVPIRCEMGNETDFSAGVGQQKYGEQQTIR